MKRAILCVDDEAIIVLSLKQELRSYFRDRFVYETALSAEKAMTVIDELAAEGTEVIIVISDWLMPGVKGDVFLERIHQKYPAIHTIIITGHADQASLQRLQESGSLSSVLNKPWRSKDLIDAVEACITEVAAESQSTTMP